MNVIQLSQLRRRNLSDPEKRSSANDPFSDLPPDAGRSIRRTIPNDESGIRFEIGRMVLYAEHFMAHPIVIKTARTITQLCPAKNKSCEMNAIYQWTKKNFRYINDPDDKEVIATPVAQINDVQTPPQVIRAILGDDLVDQMMHFGAPQEIHSRVSGEVRAERCFRSSVASPEGIRPRTSGDCDEGATFLASLLLAAAIPARFRFGGSLKDDQPNYHHVWVQGQNEMGDWVDMDITEPQRKIGWFYPNFQVYGFVPLNVPH